MPPQRPKIVGWMDCWCKKGKKKNAEKSAALPCSGSAHAMRRRKPMKREKSHAEHKRAFSPCYYNAVCKRSDSVGRVTVILCLRVAHTVLYYCAALLACLRGAFGVQHQQPRLAEPDLSVKPSLSLSLEQTHVSTNLHTALSDAPHTCAGLASVTAAQTALSTWP